MRNKFHNEDCFFTMAKMPEKSVDVVLTSPFYNTNFKAKGNKNLLNSVSKGYSHLRYDVHTDVMNNEEYCEFTVKLFKLYDKVLKKNGVVLYNISYGSENSECMFRAVNDIITMTNFTIADCIVWKKPNALPNNVSPNRLTRIFEFVFVFCRKEEEKTFYMNKKVVSTRANGQKMFENMFNFVEAKNNDGACPYNKATFSSDLCIKLLKMYAPLKKETVVYDSFMGSGTTADRKKILFGLIVGNLPDSYLQTRMICLNAKTLRNMYLQRKNHKLQEWREFCRWLKTLPHGDLIGLEHKEIETIEDCQRAHSEMTRLKSENKKLRHENFTLKSAVRKHRRERKIDG